MSRNRAAKPPAEEAVRPPSSARLPWLLLAGVVLASTVAVAAAFLPAPHNGGDNAGYLPLAYATLENGADQDCISYTADDAAEEGC